MHLKPSLYFTGGAAMAVAAVMMVASVFVRPLVGPEPIDAGKVFAWQLSLLLQFVSAGFIIAGVMVLALHYLETPHAAWGVLAVGLVIPGTAGYLAGAPTEWLYLATGFDDPALATPAAPWGVVAMAAAGRIACWLSMAAMGFALSRDRIFRSWFGPLGIAIAALEILGEVLLPMGGMLMLLWLLGFVWLFSMGMLMMQHRAQLAQPEVVAPAEPAVAV